MQEFHYVQNLSRQILFDSDDIGRPAYDPASAKFRARAAIGAFQVLSGIRRP